MPPEPRAPAVTGLLLAAGAGRRMGLPKALVTWPDGRTWLGSAVSMLLEATGDVVVVLGAQAQAATALLPDDPRVRGVVAADWADGMSASLRAGLAALLADPSAGDAALVHLVDLPDVPAAAAARVIDAVGGNMSDALARASYGGRPGHPVLLGRHHWARLAAVVGGDRGARDYLAERSVVLVECGDLATGLDHDTRPHEPG